MSYYNEVGKLTSTGEPFDPRAFAGAIPMRGRSEYGGVTGKSGPAWVDVIDTKTGKMARIRINDVGGLPQGSAPTPRVFDATPAVRDYFGGSDLHPDMQIIRLPPGKYTAGPITREQHDAAIGADRKTVDQGMGNEAAKAEATGTINVNVTAPRRTRIGARGTGLFKKVNVDRQTQMAPAAEGPSAATGGL